MKLFREIFFAGSPCKVPYFCYIFIINSIIFIKNGYFFIEKSLFPVYCSAQPKKEKKMNGNDTIEIPARKVKVTDSADICIVGGSCTGVFAAVRAARLGAKVILVEEQNRFGGVATCGLVGMWHSVYDITGEKQVIGGLTFEMLERLEKRGAVSEFRDPAESRRWGIRLNSEELTLELDAMVLEQKNIRVYLQTRYSETVRKPDGTLEALVLENKSGRFAVRADAFIDASGDAILCRDAGFPLHFPAHPQPPTACARFSGWDTLGKFNLKEICDQHRDEFPDLPCGYAWSMDIPGSTLMMFAGTRVMHCDCSDADEITRGEFESRKQIRALMDLFRKIRPDSKLALETLPSVLGIREGGHIRSLAPLRGEEMLAGTDFPDTIGCGTYPVDIHGNEDESISFMYLTGQKLVYKASRLVSEERWLPEGKILPFYRIPLRCLIPEGTRNVISAGRMLDADPVAFGAVRVMVNLNQCGEAAGVAAWQAVHHRCGIAETDFRETRRLLAAGGSCFA